MRAAGWTPVPVPDSRPPATDGDEGTGPGRCLDCRHGRRVQGARSTFWLCQRSRTDPRFSRYPRLPVLSCPGYEAREGPIAADRAGPASPP